MTVIRTTYHGRLETMAQQATRLAARQAGVQREAASGLKLERPSDDPSKISHLHRVRAQAEDQDVWIDNATFAEGILAQADRALGSMIDKMQRARELAVQMANETYSDESRELAAVEVDTMFDQVVGLANTDFGGRFVFAGTAYDGEAFDADGNYLGATGEPSVDVGSGMTVATGFDGSSLIQAGTDPFQVLGDLVSALEGGDPDAISATFDDIDEAIEQLSSARTTAGEHLSRTEDAVALAETLQTEMTREESSIVDADSVDTYTRLFELQGAYTAALQVIANSRTTPLINMI